MGTALIPPPVRYTIGVVSLAIAESSTVLLAIQARALLVLAIPLLLFGGIIATLIPLVPLLLYAAWDPAMYLMGVGLTARAGGTVLLGMFVLLAVAVRSAGGDTVRLRTPVDHVLYGLMFLTAIHLGVGLIRGNELRLIGADLFHLGVETAGTFFLITFVVRTRTELIRFLSGFFVLTAFVSLVLVLGLSLGILPGGHRIETSFRLFLGLGYPIFHLGLLIGLLLYAPRRLRPFGFALGILLLLILAATLKRTFWLALVLALVGTLPLLARPVRWRLLVTVGLISVLTFMTIRGALLLTGREATWALATAVVTKKLRSITDIRQGSVSYRMQQWSDAAELVVLNPAGYGLGSKFNITNPRALVSARHESLRQTAPRTTGVHYIHNVFLGYSLQLGLLGAMLYSLMVGIQLWYSVKLAIRAPDPLLRGVGTGTFIASMVMVLTGVTTMAANSIFPALAMGLTFAAHHQWVRASGGDPTVG